MRDSSLTRRGFIGGAVALTALSSCDPAPAPDRIAPAPPFNPRNWASVKAQFALDPSLAHLAAFVFASSPAQVRAAIAKHRAGFDANPVDYLHDHEDQHFTAIRGAATAYLGVRAEELMLTDSTTMGLGTIYHGLKLRPGDEILTSEHDFYATSEALRMRAARDGVTVRTIELYADPSTASVDEIVRNVSRALTPATRVVALTWVHSGTGVKLPVRQIADAIGGRALFCLDSVHGFGIEDAGPAELGCDFLISGCHKWLWGPRGTGLVWGKPEAWAQFQPAIPTFDIFGGPPRPSSSPGGYKAFEHQWALTETFEFHRAIGRDRIAVRTHELNARLKLGLTQNKGVRVITPMNDALSAGIVCADFGGHPPGTIVARLRENGIVASVTPYAVPYVRFGASIVTDESDVDRVLEAVKSIRPGS